MPAAYDDENIFAKILKGQLPAHKVYEDDHAIAFMDVMPQGKGHTLIVPKAPSRNLLDANMDVLARLLPITQKIANAVKSAFDADGVTVMQFNDEAGGQTVFHLHIHVIPRFTGVALGRHSGGMEKDEILSDHAEKIKKALNDA